MNLMEIEIPSSVEAIGSFVPLCNVQLVSSRLYDAHNIYRCIGKVCAVMQDTKWKFVGKRRDSATPFHQQPVTESESNQSLKKSYRTR